MALEDEALLAQGPRIETVPGGDPEERLLPAQAQQRAVESPGRRMGRLLEPRPVEPARAKGLGVLRVRDPLAGGRARERGEGRVLPAPSLDHPRSEPFVVVREEEERARGRPLLAHEEQRHFRSGEQQHARRAPDRGLDLMMQPFPVGAVAHLVVVLRIEDEAPRREARRGFAPGLAVVGGALALVEPALAHGPGQVPKRPVVVLVVPLGVAGQDPPELVVEVVGPLGVEAVPAFPLGPHQPPEVASVLRDQDEPARRRRAEPRPHLGQQVPRPVVAKRVRGVEAQPIEVVLVHPVEGVLDKELPHALRVWAIEVQGVAPRRGLALGEIVRAVGAHVGPVGAEVVVDDVEDDPQAEAVGRVHEPPQVVGAAVGTRGCEESHPVVAPVPLAGEVGHRHELDRGDAEVAQVGQPLHHARERPRGGERAHVQLVQRQVVEGEPRPAPVVPLEAGGVHDLGWAVDALGLEARGRIGERALAVHAIAIAPAGLDLWHDTHERAVGLLLQGDGGRRAVEHQLDALASGRPHAEPCATLLDPCAERGPPGRGAPHAGRG